MRTIPKTTNEQILKYNTAYELCHCPDFEGRGGSYQDINGDRCCKHMIHYRNNVRYAEERNIMIEVQAYEAQAQAQQEQAAKAQQAIERLYGPSVQVVAPVQSLLEWADFLEIDAPAKPVPAKKESAMTENPEYAEWLFAHFEERGAQGPEPEKFIFR